MPAGRRILPQSLSTDPRFARLSLKAKVLYPLLWVNADDQGRLSGNADKVKLAVCPSVPEIASEDIPSLIDEMVRAKSPGDAYGLVIHYNTSKAAAIQITDWWGPGGQRPQWAWPSEFEAPPGWQDHLRYKRGREHVILENWPPSAPNYSPETSPESPPEASPESSGALGRLNANSNAKETQTQTQTQTQYSLRGETRSPPPSSHYQLKTEYYRHLYHADNNQGRRAVLVRFLREQLHQEGRLYGQVGKMVKMLGSPFEVMAVMLDVWDRDRGEPLLDPMAFLWAMVNEHAGVGKKGTQRTPPD